MSLIPGGTGTTTKAVDGIEGATTGAPVSFPSGFQGGQVPSQLADANATLTAASNSAQVMTPTANRTITLPSSGVVTNYPFTIINLSPTFTITVLASGGQTITTLAQGTVTVAASQNAPTLAAQWIQLSNLASQTLLNKQISSTSSLTGALTLPAGSAAQRPTPVAGMTRLNTDSNSFEGYANGIWSSIGGGLNNQPVTNYLKTYAEANVAPGTLSTLASAAANLVSLTSFYADATSGAAALSSSTDSTLRGTANYLSAVSGSDSAGARFFQFPAFAIEGTDLGKPISIFADVSGVTTDGNWDVVVVRYNSTGIYQSIISVAGNASGATPASAKLPTGVAPFNGFFIPDSTTATDLYAIRYRSLANAVQIRLDSLMAGNQPVRVGAAVTDWQSYTPTTQGLGASAFNVWWRRNGSTLEIAGYFDTAATAAEARIFFPNGYVGTSGGVNYSAVKGRLFRGINNTSARKTMTLFTSNTSAAGGYLLLGNDDYTSAGDSVTALIGSNVVGSETVRFHAQGIEIAGWSSNVTMADRSVEEYCSNSSSTDANDTTSFVYGNAGSVGILGVTNLTAPRSKRVRFQTPIQATDTLILEFRDLSGVWRPSESHSDGSYSYQNQNGTPFGVVLSGVLGSTTDADVSFQTYNRPGGAGFSVGTSSWGAAFYAAQNWRWRVRKVSSGAQIGGAINASNIVGRVDGSVVGVGYIGQQLVSTGQFATVTSTTSTIASVTITPGVWLLLGQMTFNGATTASAKLSVKTGTGDGTIGDDFVLSEGNAAGRVAISVNVYANVSASTTYNLNAASAATQTGNVGFKLLAVRVA